MKRRLLIFLPLICALGVFALFAYVNNQNAGGRDGAALPSALLGKPAPQLALGVLDVDGTLPFDNALFSQGKKGQVFVLNVWASWCLPCRAEHPFIEAIGEREDVVLIGLNQKDDPEKAKGFLAELGNPYNVIGTDPEGRNSLDLGVYGVPETFLIDHNGIIRTKFVGPISAESLQNEVVPAIIDIATSAQ